MFEVVMCSTGQREHYRRALHSVQFQMPSQEGHFISPLVNLYGIDREQTVLQSTSEWLLFLDENCALPDAAYFQRLESLVRKHPNVAIWSGLYLSSPNEDYTTRAYIHFCNFWVLLSQSQKLVFDLLGGCLIVHVPTVKALLEARRHRTDLRKNSTAFSKASPVFCISKNLSVYCFPRSETLKNFWLKVVRANQQMNEGLIQKFKLSIHGMRYAFAHFVYWPLWLYFLLQFIHRMTKLQIKRLERKLRMRLRRRASRRSLVEDATLPTASPSG